MKIYKIRKHRGRLASAPVVSQDNLIKACEEANEECYGFYPSYEAYEYTNNKLTNVYELRVVKPSVFARISFPTLMREIKL